MQYSAECAFVGLELLSLLFGGGQAKAAPVFFFWLEQMKGHLRIAPDLPFQPQGGFHDQHL